MTTKDLANVAHFVSMYPHAWGEFERIVSADVKFVSFSFNVDKGSWELIDSSGASHFFREYRNEILAITSSFGNCVFVDGEVVKI